MRIGELQEHCGDCSLMEYCSEPYETPQLCTCEKLNNVTEERYMEVAESITEKEINDKLRQEENNSDYDNKRTGAILEIVLEKLNSKGERA